jgi:two-component system, chemotaxis family, protein-glutamate methylesterase/glutaminase
MPGHDIVVVGASAGGVEALGVLAGALPADLDAAVFVVLHIPANSASALPAILSRRGPLPATHARHGEPIEAGRIYVAPPDHHLLVVDGAGKIELARGPRENGHRPSVDLLFRSAAAAFGPRVVGVVLSGSMHDGVAGAAAIKRHGGTVLVQDPLDALAAGMPEATIAHVAVDQVGPIPALAATIQRLSREPAADPGPAIPHELAVETGTGDPSGFPCPECGGELWEQRQAGVTHFRCRVGHAWSAEDLLGQEEERSALAHRLRDAATARGHGLSAERFEHQGRHAEQAAERIRDFLSSKSGQGPADGT